MPLINGNEGWIRRYSGILSLLWIGTCGFACERIVKNSMARAFSSNALTIFYFKLSFRNAQQLGKDHNNDAKVFSILNIVAIL